MSTTRNFSLLILALVALLAFVGCTREITTVVSETPEPASCFECHSDQDLTLVAIETQWANSVHASGNNTNRNSASCAACHTGTGFILANPESGPVALTETVNNPAVIHCFACHQPHTNLDSSFPLRVTAAQALADGETIDIGAGNLCAACHHGRTAFSAFNGSINNRFGPHHSPQADLLNGTLGYEYDGYTYVKSTAHTSPNNPDGCVTCHVRTGGQSWVVGGHSFNMRATIDGVEGEDPSEVITTESCENCHDDFGDDFDYNMVQTEVDSLLGELHALLETAGLVNASGSPISATGVDELDAGAIWNFKYVEEDRSRGIHNPDYARGLLQSAIEHMSAGK